ncbi:hypothetical protein ACJX0J_041107 [Zea mays]
MYMESWEDKLILVLFPKKKKKLKNNRASLFLSLETGGEAKKRTLMKKRTYKVHLLMWLWLISAINFMQDGVGGLAHYILPLDLTIYALRYVTKYFQYYNYNVVIFVKKLMLNFKY